MEAEIKIKKTVQIKKIQMDLAVRYGEQDIPSDFPGRKGDILSLRVNIDTGEIEGFPKDFQTNKVYMKVCDQGSYYLLDDKGVIVASILDNYVPHGVVPGEYGDYVDFDISSGVITNWPKLPNIDEFFIE